MRTSREIIPPVLFAVDLDRCTYDTDAGAAKMTRLAVSEGLATTDEITRARAEVENSAGSFDMLGYLEANGRSALEIQCLADTFGRNQEGDELLYADTPQLFRAFKETDTPYFIATKGGLVWQTAKLQSAKLDTSDLYNCPHLITDKTRKGELAEEYMIDDGTFRIVTNIGAHATQTVSGKDVKIIEDKITGFMRSHGSFGGFHVMRSQKLLASQEGTLPPDVVQSRDLSVAIEYIYLQAEQRSK